MSFQAKRVRASAALLSLLLAAIVALSAGCYSAPDEPPQLPLEVTDPSSPGLMSADQPTSVSPLPTPNGSPFTSTGAVDVAAGLSRAGPMSPLFDAATQSIRIAGAANETVSFQVSFAGPAEGLSGLRLALSDMELSGAPVAAARARIDRETFEVFRVLPVRATNLPAWHRVYESAAANRQTDDFYDAMIPSDHNTLGEPWTLKPGEKLVAWVDVPVPRDASPGVYNGSVIVSSANFPDRRIAVRLEVLPVVLPEALPLTMLAPLDAKRLLASELGQIDLNDSLLFESVEPLASKRLAQWIELGRRHGVQFLVSDIAPIFKRDLAGQVRVDWSGYDRLIGPLLAGPGAPPVWLAPFRLDYPDATLYGGFGGKGYGEIATQYLRSIGGHFQEKKWPRPMVWVHRDTPSPITLPYGAADPRDCLTQQRQRESRSVGALVRKSEYDIGYIEMLPWTRAAGPAAAASPAAALPAHVSVYCPPAQFLDPAAMSRLPRETRAWLGLGDPPWRPSTELFAPPEQIEALAYLAQRYGLETVWLTGPMRAPRPSPLKVAVDAANANFLLYPGHWFGQDRPVASLRLKFLRHAAQTAAYLHLLRQNGRAAQADAVAAAVVRYALADAQSSTPGIGGEIGWLQEPAFYTDARALLRQELARSASKSRDAAAEDKLRFAWMQFNERTRWTRLTLLPGQLTDQLDSFGARGDRMAALLRLNVFSDGRGGASSRPDRLSDGLDAAKLLFGKLPATWSAVRYNVSIGATADVGGPGGQVVLASEGRELPIDASGRVSMPLVLKAGTGIELASLPAEVPVLPGHLFRKPPMIDGQLDDWPVSSWFRGGAFRRLQASRPISVYDQPSPRPADTWFMVGYDEQNFYVAVVCREQKPSQVTPRYSNELHFDRGLITGEDAVELVLDPSGGQLGRGELYHLAVKATGTLIGWRGLAGPGGAGAPPPWGQKARVELSFRPEYWVVELAIPKAELGKVNEQGLWRMNVARHLAARGEHSAWASSYPLLGEPVSLGNVLLRPPPLPRIEVPLTPPSPLDSLWGQP